MTAVHGAGSSPAPWEASTRDVLESVLRERRRQVATYGHNEELEDGTGPQEPWLAPVDPAPAVRVQESFRHDYEQHDQPTWMRLVREEVAEAFQENDPRLLEEELIQVAALCVSWVEKLRRRAVPYTAPDGLVHYRVGPFLVTRGKLGRAWLVTEGHDLRVLYRSPANPLEGRASGLDRALRWAADHSGSAAAENTLQID